MNTIAHTNRSTPTVTDQFCGAGGSTTGAKAAGAVVKLALNHSQLAIDTHSTNHPEVWHDCTDIQASDPRRYPTTDILITSPECTNHSIAKGRKRTTNQMELFDDDAPVKDGVAERSRATMWDVPRFAEHHEYECIIVENVVDARMWRLWDSWIHAMTLLDYEYEIVYFNSMFAPPTPQSRDRMYVVLWKKGRPKPNLKFTPPAYCPKCEKVIEAQQAWKKPQFAWGRYGERRQYVYICPHCLTHVRPYYSPAFTAIDWSLPLERIGDKKRPLKDGTIRRIKAGLEKFVGRGLPMLTNLAFAYNTKKGYVYPVVGAWPTQTTAQTVGLTIPPFFSSPIHSNTIRSDASHNHHVGEPSPTQTTQALQRLIVPPFVSVCKSEGYGRDLTVDEAFSTQTTEQANTLVIPPFLHTMSGGNYSPQRGLDEAMRTQMACASQTWLVAPPFIHVQRENHDCIGLDDAFATMVATAVQHQLVVPPFVMDKYTNHGEHPVDDPSHTVIGWDARSLVIPPGSENDIVMSYFNNPTFRGMFESIGAVTTLARHSLLQPGELPDVEDCGFRMIRSHEIQRTMAFPDSYIVLGTEREKVMQLGNAVTPPAEEMLMERVMETFNGGGYREYESAAPMVVDWQEFVDPSEMEDFDD